MLCPLGTLMAKATAQMADHSWSTAPQGKIGQVSISFVVHSFPLLEWPSATSQMCLLRQALREQPEAAAGPVPMSLLASTETFSICSNYSCFSWQSIVIDGIISSVNALLFCVCVLCLLISTYGYTMVIISQKEKQLSHEQRKQKCSVEAIIIGTAGQRSRTEKQDREG